MEMKDLGNTPISDDAPAGSDVRYEPSFESLSQEIAKLGSPSASSGIDWDNVVALSVQILEKESKHLQVASYLNYGLLKTKGLEGLILGTHVLKEIIENFWDAMFPPKKRMKGRIGILNWWSEKTMDFVSGVDPVTWDKEKRDGLIDEFNAIDAFLGDNVEDAPLLLPLIRKIQEVIQEEAPPEPEVEAAPEAAPETSQASAAAAPSAPKTAPPKTQASPAPAAPPSDADASTILTQGLGFLGKAASGLRKENRTHPLPYRLSRIAAWIPIDGLPSATGGKTMIPPPDSQIISAITGLYDAGNWEALADSCEGKVRQFLFWLDLSRYVAESMEQQGHDDVARVVESETALFTERLKGIEKLAFSDGTPFADAATVEWIKQIRSKGSGQADASPADGDDGIGRRIGQKTGEALQLIKEKKLDAALLLFKKQVFGAASLREQFLWKTGLCRILINAKQIKIAASYIDDILNTIETYHLETWEPETAIDALSLALTGLRLQKNDQHAQTIETIIKRISMLDPVKALEMV